MQRGTAIRGAPGQCNSPPLLAQGVQQGKDSGAMGAPGSGVQSRAGAGDANAAAADGAVANEFVGSVQRWTGEQTEDGDVAVVGGVEEGRGIDRET